MYNWRDICSSISSADDDALQRISKDGRVIPSHESAWRRLYSESEDMSANEDDLFELIKAWFLAWPLGIFLGFIYTVVGVAIAIIARCGCYRTSKKGVSTSQQKRGQ